jgi:hypothetical protein
MTEFQIIRRDERGRFTKGVETIDAVNDDSSNGTGIAGIIILSVWGALCAIVGFIAGTFQ